MNISFIFFVKGPYSEQVYRVHLGVKNPQNTLSVTQAAELWDVDRGAVGYWS